MNPAQTFLDEVKKRGLLIVNSIPQVRSLQDGAVLVEAPQLVVTKDGKDAVEEYNAMVKEMGFVVNWQNPKVRIVQDGALLVDYQLNVQQTLVAAVSKETLTPEEMPSPTPDAAAGENKEEEVKADESTKEGEAPKEGSTEGEAV